MRHFHVGFRALFFDFSDFEVVVVIHVPSPQQNKCKDVCTGSLFVSIKMQYLNYAILGKFRSSVYKLI